MLNNWFPNTDTFNFKKRTEILILQYLFYHQYHYFSKKCFTCMTYHIPYHNKQFIWFYLFRAYINFVTKLAFSIRILIIGMASLLYYKIKIALYLLGCQIWRWNFGWHWIVENRPFELCPQKIFQDPWFVPWPDFFQLILQWMKPVGVEDIVSLISRSSWLAKKKCWYTQIESYRIFYPKWTLVTKCT